MQHNIVRGIERAKIFRNNTDSNNFLNRMGNLVTGTKSGCFAWGKYERLYSAPGDPWPGWLMIGVRGALVQ